MPYDPKALTQDDRAFSMGMMWVGLAASLILFAGVLLGFFETVRALAGGFAAGSLIGLPLIGRQDEYFKSLIAFAARWACAVIGIWLFASVLSFSKGYVEDHLIWLTATVATFHLAFTYARLRGL